MVAPQPPTIDHTSPLQRDTASVPSASAPAEPPASSPEQPEAAVAAAQDAEAEDPREAMRAIIEYFVEQIQTGRTMEQIVAWVHENMPEYANDIDTVIPFVRRVRISAQT